MQKIIGFLFFLSSLGFGAIGSLTIPHDIDSAAIPKVIYIDQNNDSIVNKVNEIKDTVNAYLPGGGVYSGTSLTSTGNLRLTVDSDNNGTGNCLAMTHNGATDTIAKFCDDLSTKAFGALSITGRTTLTDSLIGVSQRLSGNLAAVNGAFSGTLGVTGVQTNADRLTFSTNASGAAGSLWKSSGSGLVLQGVTASTYDLAILNNASQPLIRNPTGTQTVEFSGPVVMYSTTLNSGAVTNSSTLTQTGAATFASTIGATGKITGSDSIVATSGLRVGSDITLYRNGANMLRIADSAIVDGRLQVGGSVTADTIISPDFHSFGTFTGTMTGFSGTPTTTARWERVGQNVTICLDSASGTSNTTTFTITGMPAGLYPARNSYAGVAPFRNPVGAGELMATVIVQTDGVIRLDPVEESSISLKWGAYSWSATASTKGVGGTDGSLVIASVCFTYNRR